MASTVCGTYIWVQASISDHCEHILWWFVLVGAYVAKWRWLWAFAQKAMVNCSD
jgi:hypothetical protein